MKQKGTNKKAKPDVFAMTIRLPKEIRPALEEKAQEERRSLNSLIGVVLENYLEAKARPS